ncbi:MAG: class I SAM-dependent methyltransferase [Ginsengibacter sp.]
MSSNMYIDGTYFNNNPGWGIKDSNWKAAIILQLLNSNHIVPGEVTEVGCGAGGILESLSKSIQRKISFYGYDISPQAIALAKEKERDNLIFFNEDFISKDIHTDLLLTIDVIEHVDDYYGFLSMLKSRSNYFVFHIPLDLSCRMVLKPHILLQQRNSVGHIHYFTKEMVLWFLQDTGFEIVDWVYTRPVTDKEPSPGFKRNIKKILRNVSFSLNKDMSAKLWGSYSMMILAK